MSQTNHLFAKDASIRFRVDAGSFNFSADGNNTEIDFNADDLEATAYGDLTHTYLQGLTNYTFTVTAWWAGSHATKVDDSHAACIFRMVYQSSTCRPEFQINPAGSAAGSLSYAGCVNVQAMPMSFPADNIATMNLTLTSRAGSLTACPDSIWG